MITNNSRNDAFFQLISKIIGLISSEDWNRAKTIWVLLILKVKHNSNLDFSCWESEYNAFISHYEKYQAIFYNCDICNKLLKSNICSLYLVKDENNNTYININEFAECVECKTLCQGKFVSTPFCLLVEICSEKYNINLNDIPLQITIDGNEYHFLFFTLFVKRNHFRSIFRLNSKFYLIDNLKKGFQKKIPLKMKFGTIFYYLIKK